MRLLPHSIVTSEASLKFIQMYRELQARALLAPTQFYGSQAAKRSTERERNEGGDDDDFDDNNADNDLDNGDGGRKRKNKGRGKAARGRGRGKNGGLVFDLLCSCGASKSQSSLQPSTYDATAS